MSGKKVNPRRRPATEADVRRAKDSARNDAVMAVWAIVLTALRDKEGFSKEALKRVWDESLDISDSILHGYITVQDLVYTLREEAGIKLEEK